MQKLKEGMCLGYLSIIVVVFFKLAANWQFLLGLGAVFNSFYIFLHPLTFGLIYWP